MNARRIEGRDAEAPRSPVRDLYHRRTRSAATLPYVAALSMICPAVLGQQATEQPPRAACAALPNHGELTQRLRDIVTPADPTGNGGLGNHVWSVVVDRGGSICAVARSGDSANAQWLGSRTIAASKAYTANAFSLPHFALSTANLYWPSQPDNSLYGLEVGNPLDPRGLYDGEISTWGTAEDPLIGRRVGGSVVFGGGLALYSTEGELVGALGISGDQSCTDHVIAWKLRGELGLGNVPDGPSADNNDNIVYDITTHPGNGKRSSSSGFGHPECGARSRSIAERFTSAAPADGSPLN